MSGGDCGAGGVSRVWDTHRRSTSPARVAASRASPSCDLTVQTTVTDGADTSLRRVYDSALRPCRARRRVRRGGRATARRSRARSPRPPGRAPRRCRRPTPRARARTSSVDRLPSTSGAPLAPGVHGTPWNRSPSGRPLAKRRATPAWSTPSTLTPNWPRASSGCSVREVLGSATATIGSSPASAMKDRTATPIGRPSPSTAETTTIPPANAFGGRAHVVLGRDARPGPPGRRQPRGPPGQVAADDVGRPVHADVLQRRRGQAGADALGVEHDDVQVAVRQGQPVGAGRVQPPLEHVAVDDQRARHLPLGGPLDGRPDVHEHRPLLERGGRLPRLEAAQPRPGLAHQLPRAPGLVPTAHLAHPFGRFGRSAVSVPKLPCYTVIPT